MDTFSQDEFESAEIYMTITDTNIYGQSEIFELENDSSNIKVTIDNYVDYKNKILDFYYLKGDRKSVV